MVGILNKRRRNGKARRPALARAADHHAATLAGWSAADMAEAVISPEQQAVEDYKRHQAGAAPRRFVPPRKSWGTPENPAPLTNMHGEPPPELREHKHGAVVRHHHGTEIVFVDKDAT